VVLYQFSARGHDVPQVMLGGLLDRPHDGAAAYYRSRPLLLALGLSAEDALASPLGRSGGFSDGRDIGVVCNLPTRGGPMVLPMAGDVGGQYTPVAGWAQSVLYHRDELGDRAWDGALGVALGGEASVATSGFWSALTMATTLGLPVLFYVEDNGLGISVPSSFQTPGGNIAANLASFGNLFVRDGDGSDPLATALLLAEVVAHVRSGEGPALVRLTVPRLSSHSGPDNHKAYRTEAEIAADVARDPLPEAARAPRARRALRARLGAIEAEVERDVAAALAEARARPTPDAATVKRFVYAEPARAGRRRRRTAGSRGRRRGARRHRRAAGGRRRGALRGGGAAHAAARAGGEPARARLRRGRGREGRRAPRHRGAAEALRRARVFDTSLSEEGIVGRAVGMAYSGLVPVAEIQFRKYADPAAEQLNNCGTVRWRTNNRFAAPVVVRMPGGFGKDVGDPWHSLSDEVRFAHALGWQVAMPSDASDAVGLLRAAMRSPNPSIFFEHRALLMTSDGSAPYPATTTCCRSGAGACCARGTRSPW
jgi:2-oxoisovalerate dehydrogenase E1 component